MNPALTPSQNEAIRVDRHLAVEAGAGAGKTTVLVARYLAILASNPTLKPANILTITFTKKAASELQGRIQTAIQDRLSDTLEERIQTLAWQEGFDSAEIGTISSFCGKILRDWGYLIQVDPQFKILDEWDSQLMWQHTQDDWLTDALSRGYGPLKEALTATPLARLRDMWNREFKRRDAPNGLQDPIITELLQAYENRLMACQQLDFSMIQSKTLQLLDQYPTVSKSIAEDFPFVMIDEFQDTDPTQWAILKSITQIDTPTPRCNVFVVGDIKQSIYGFRGSDPSLFQRILTDFQHRPDAEVVHLSENFRSQAPLITFYNTLFSRVFSENSSFPILYTPLSPNRPTLSHGVDIILSESNDQELVDVCNWLLDQHESGLPWRNCAIIARNSAILTKLTGQLTAFGIPHTMLSQQNPFHTPSMQSVLSVVCYVLDPSRPEHRVAFLSSSWSDQLPPDWQSDGASKGYLSVLDHLFLNDSDWQWIRPLISRFVAPHHILSHIQSLLVETHHPTLANRSESTVTLMTIHAAKGLEFDTVIMIGNGSSRKKSATVQPITDSEAPIEDSTASEWDEERRIFYVGCTRAKTHLLLSGTLPKPNSDPDDPPSRYFDMMLRHATISDSDVTIHFPGEPIAYQIKRVKPMPKTRDCFNPPTDHIAQPIVSPASSAIDSNTDPSVTDIEISVSHLVNWLTCRRQYDLRNALSGLIQSQGCGQAARMGTLVHRLIERRLRGQTIDSETVAALGRLTHATPTEQTDAFDQVVALQNTAYFTDIYNNGACNPEWDIQTQIGRFWIKGRMDCLTQRTDQPWMITDFKTGNQPQAVDARHWQQLLVYAVCVAQQYGVNTNMVINLVYTQSGMIQHRVVSATERNSLRALIENLPTVPFTPPPQSTCLMCPVYDWNPSCPTQPTIR